MVRAKTGIAPIVAGRRRASSGKIGSIGGERRGRRRTAPTAAGPGRGPVAPAQMSGTSATSVDSAVNQSVGRATTIATTSNGSPIRGSSRPATIARPSPTTARTMYGIGTNEDASPGPRERRMSTKSAQARGASATLTTRMTSPTTDAITRIPPSAPGGQVHDPETWRDLDRGAHREQHRPAPDREHDEHGQDEVDVAEPELGRDRDVRDEREGDERPPAREPDQARDQQRRPGPAERLGREDRRDRRDDLRHDRRIPVGERGDGRGRRVVERLAVEQPLPGQPVGVLVVRQRPAARGDHDEEDRPERRQQDETRGAGVPSGRAAWARPSVGGGWAPAGPGCPSPADASRWSAGVRRAFGTARVTIQRPCDASRRRSSPSSSASPAVALLAVAVFGGPAATPGVVPSASGGSPRRPGASPSRPPRPMARRAFSPPMAPRPRRGPAAERSQRPGHDRRVRARRRLPVHGPRRRRRRHRGRRRRHGQALDPDRDRRLGRRGHRRGAGRAWGDRHREREDRPRVEPDRARPRPGQGLEADRVPARVAGDPGGPRDRLGRARPVRRRPGQDDDRLEAHRHARRRLQAVRPRPRPGRSSRAATSCSTAASTSRSTSWARAPTSRSTAARPTIVSRHCCSSFDWPVPIAKRTGNAGAVRHLLTGADIAVANFENPAPDAPRYHTEGTVFSADPRLITGLKNAGIDVRLDRQQPHRRRRRGGHPPDDRQPRQVRHQARGCRQEHSPRPTSRRSLNVGGVKVAILAYDTIAKYYTAGRSTPGSARSDRRRRSRPMSPPPGRPAPTSSSSTRTGAPSTTRRRSPPSRRWPGRSSTPAPT